MTTVFKIHPGRYLVAVLVYMFFAGVATPLLGQQFSYQHQAVTDLEVLASAQMTGRGTGTEGNQRARNYIIKRLQEIGVKPLGNSYEQPFSATDRQGKPIKGINVVGAIQGSGPGYLVVSAHYDHLGKRFGRIFFGADDNASGVAAMLALADYFANNPPVHTLLLVAFDAEEHGLVGARQFVTHCPVPINKVVLNINMDMVSRSSKQELYAAGTYHYPQLKPLLQTIAGQHPGVKVKFGHDGAPGSGEDWSTASDHGPFHRKGIPFIYFGVEDHADYHKPTDTFDKINQKFYNDVVRFITHATKHIDANL